MLISILGAIQPKFPQSPSPTPPEQTDVPATGKANGFSVQTIFDIARLLVPTNQVAAAMNDLNTLTEPEVSMKLIQAFKTGQYQNTVHVVLSGITFNIDEHDDFTVPPNVVLDRCVSSGPGRIYFYAGSLYVIHSNGQGVALGPKAKAVGLADFSMVFAYGCGAAIAYGRSSTAFAATGGRAFYFHGHSIGITYMRGKVFQRVATDTLCPLTPGDPFHADRQPECEALISTLDAMDLDKVVSEPEICEDKACSKSAPFSSVSSTSSSSSSSWRLVTSSQPKPQQGDDERIIPLDSDDSTSGRPMAHSRGSRVIWSYPQTKMSNQKLKQIAQFLVPAVQMQTICAMLSNLSDLAISALVTEAIERGYYQRNVHTKLENLMFTLRPGRLYIIPGTVELDACQAKGSGKIHFSKGTLLVLSRDVEARAQGPQAHVCAWAPQSTVYAAWGGRAIARGWQSVAVALDTDSTAIHCPGHSIGRADNGGRVQAVQPKTQWATQEFTLPILVRADFVRARKALNFSGKGQCLVPETQKAVIRTLQWGLLQYAHNELWPSVGDTNKVIAQIFKNAFDYLYQEQFNAILRKVCTGLRIELRSFCWLVNIKDELNNLGVKFELTDDAIVMTSISGSPNVPLTQAIAAALESMPKTINDQIGQYAREQL